jgi:hypothetical protein
MVNLSGRVGGAKEESRLRLGDLFSPSRKRLEWKVVNLTG